MGIESDLEFVIEANIERFQRLLENEADSKIRSVIGALLGEELVKRSEAIAMRPAGAVRS